MQLRHAEEARQREQRETDVEFARIAYMLSRNICKDLNYVIQQFEAELKKPGHKIGPERFDDLQNSLTELMHRNIRPSIFREILVIKRELATTQTEIRQFNCRVAPDEHTTERLEKARQRLSVVARSRRRLKNAVIRAKADEKHRF